MGSENGWRGLNHVLVSSSSILSCSIYFVHQLRGKFLSSQSSSILKPCSTSFQHLIKVQGTWENDPQEPQSEKRELSLSHENIKFKSQISKDVGKAEMAPIKARGVHETRTGLLLEDGTLQRGWTSWSKLSKCWDEDWGTSETHSGEALIPTDCGQFSKSPTKLYL